MSKLRKEWMLDRGFDISKLNQSFDQEYIEWLENKIEENFIPAIYVIDEGAIYYSRSNHDFRQCDNGVNAVDGGTNPITFGFSFTDDYKPIHIKIRTNKLLEMILHYDWKLGVPDKEQWKDGLHGKFTIKKNTDKEFFRELIINFEDVEKYFDDIIDKELKNITKKSWRIK